MSEKQNGNGQQEKKEHSVQQMEQDLPVVSNIPAHQLEQTIARAEQFVKFVQRIIKLAIGMTNTEDWIDQNGTPYLEASGCAKIARGFGIRLYDPKVDKDTVEDDKGFYYIYRVTVSGEWQGNTVTEIGTCSTRDKFFAQRNGEPLPLSEVDLTNVQKKAHTNALNRLTKRLLGLSFEWSEINEASGGKITRERVTGVKYQTGSRGGNTDSEETKKRKAELAKRIYDFCGGKKADAQEWLRQQTAWQKKDGTDMPGKNSVNKLTDKQLPFVEKAIAKAITEADQQIDEYREQL